MMPRRHALALGLLLAAAPAFAAHAADYPTGPVTIVVGAAPGASGDLTARVLAQRLSEKWKQPVVVENKSGASGVLASNEVLKARPDGHTIYISNDSTSINPGVMKNPPFDPRVVFAPITLIALIDFKLVVHPDVPAKTVQELIDYAKSQPGKLNYSSSGQYTPHHLMAELFRYMAGIQATHVPFRGTAPSVTSVVSGRSAWTFSGFPGVDAQIKAGQLRALATTGAKRNAASPELPTVGETLKGFSAGSWWGMLLRVETPKEIQEKLNADVVALIKDPDVDQKMRNAGLDPVGSTAAEFTAFINEEVEKWLKLPEGVIEKQ